jgi:hypothetical protein
MAKMTEWPKQLRDARRCGAHARTTGKPCMAPAVRNRPRCRMHGCAPGSGSRPEGSRPGEHHPRYKHGRYTKRSKQLGRYFRKLAKDVDVATASVMTAAGLKPTKPLRRKRHVVRALAKAKEKAKEGKT